MRSPANASPVCVAGVRIRSVTAKQNQRKMDDEVAKEEARLMKAFQTRCPEANDKKKATPEWKRRQRAQQKEDEERRAAEAAADKAKKEAEKEEMDKKMEAIRNGTYVEPSTEIEAEKKADSGVSTESTITNFSNAIDDSEAARREEARLMRLISPRGGSGKPVI